MSTLGWIIVSGPLMSALALGSVTLLLPERTPTRKSKPKPTTAAPLPTPSKSARACPEGREILTLADQYLALYAERTTGRALHWWLGECHVHADIHSEDVNA